MENYELLSACYDYKIETYKEAITRYEGFGKGFYEALILEYSDILNHMTFYQAIRDNGYCIPCEPDLRDSYSVYNDGTTAFSIQLDVLSQKIIIWRFAYSIEIGDWEENPIQAALNFIRENFLP